MSNPAFSAGARYERKAVREYLERKLKRWKLTSDRMGIGSYGPELALYQRALRWVRTRERRYSRRPGGHSQYVNGGRHAH